MDVCMLCMLRHMIIVAFLLCNWNLCFWSIAAFIHSQMAFLYSMYAKDIMPEYIVTFFGISSALFVA